MRGLSERVGPAWGTSAEEIRMECGSGGQGRGQCTPVTGRVQSHALECIDVTYRDVASSSVVHSGA